MSVIPAIQEVEVRVRGQPGIIAKPHLKTMKKILKSRMSLLEFPS
jgi:uncharacterized protein (UPF0218 family)